MNELQREADRLELRRQLDAAARCLIDSRSLLQRRLREAAYPLSMVPTAVLPAELRADYDAIWQSFLGNHHESPHELARIDATLAGMTSADMAALLARVVALCGRIHALDTRYGTIEEL